ncbi:MAG: helix-turn-helix transcriptional regulator [Bacteroidales bacterium]|jgi:transcriptional regulator with XRE-family HTH domain
MDVDNIKERILEFLRTENRTSAQFAQEIGVQPSGISHIISGRNKPSLEFIIKMLTRYPSLSTDWLLFGTGPMFREGESIDLFTSQKENLTSARDIFSNMAPTEVKKTDPGRDKINIPGDERPSPGSSDKPRTSRIVIFKEDGTFSEHYPE